jgi:transcriptional repressor NrdR
MTILGSQRRNPSHWFPPGTMILQMHPLIIIKKDNNREAYDRSKIEAGVLRACHKRPVSAQQITTLVDEVENEIFNREEREIPSGTIGELVMNKLKDLDAVAYVRFASVYREFKDVNTFMDELKSVLNDKNPM